MTAGSDKQVEAFWRVIESARGESGGDLERQTKLIEEHLMKSNASEIVAFQKQFDALMDKANTWDLMAACYLINGEAFDGIFDCFCAWLVMRGKEFYEATVESPESLADFPEFQLYKVMWCEITELPERIYREKVGRYTGLRRDYTNLKGSPWEEDELWKRYPRLWATFGEWRADVMGGSP
nr:DUF4240 domain-containing protein [Deinococcus aestuarii]